MPSEVAGPLKVLPRQVWEVRQRSRQSVDRSGRTRLHHTQVGAGRHTQARQLIGGNAPVRGHDQLVTSVLACCTHDTKCSPTTPARSTVGDVAFDSSHWLGVFEPIRDPQRFAQATRPQ